jgi:hypothetical protein
VRLETFEQLINVGAGRHFRFQKPTNANPETVRRNVMKDNDEIKVGDWVRAYSKGIWQVYRIDSGVYDPIFSSKSIPKKRDDKSVYVKRLVNDKWKRSLATESCSDFYVSKISPQELSEVKKFISDNPKIFVDFEKYTSPIDSCLNIPFYVSNPEQRTEFNDKVKNIFENIISSGLSNPEIIDLIEKNKLDKYTHDSIRNSTIQFTSKDSETAHGHLIYRAFRTLGS